jgi:transcriptional regulator with XRE-family HTH domain
MNSWTPWARRSTAATPNWTRERLEKALDTLQEGGVIAHWQYDRWDETAVERRGWVGRWRESTLLIAPPAVVVDHYRQARPPLLRAESSQVPVKDLPDSPDELGQLIKNRRARLGLNQAQAGDALGATPGYISKLERGKVPDIRQPRQVEAEYAGGDDAIVGPWPRCAQTAHNVRPETVLDNPEGERKAPLARHTGTLSQHRGDTGMYCTVAECGRGIRRSRGIVPTPCAWFPAIGHCTQASPR